MMRWDFVEEIGGEGVRFCFEQGILMRGRGSCMFDNSDEGGMRRKDRNPDAPGERRWERRGGDRSIVVLWDCRGDGEEKEDGVGDARETCHNC